MDPLEGLVKPKDPFSEKCISIYKTEVVRDIDVNKHFWSLEATSYFDAYVRY